MTAQQNKIPGWEAEGAVVPAAGLSSAFHSQVLNLIKDWWAALKHGQQCKINYQLLCSVGVLLMWQDTLSALVLQTV